MDRKVLGITMKTSLYFNIKSSVNHVGIYFILFFKNHSVTKISHNKVTYALILVIEDLF